VAFNDLLFSVDGGLAEAIGSFSGNTATDGGLTDIVLGIAGLRLRTLC
jgi:hypothetical protein